MTQQGTDRPPQTPDQAALEIDATGLQCPLPVLWLRKGVARVPAGAALRLIATDPMTRIDVPAFCHQEGLTLEDMSVQADGSFVYHVRKTNNRQEVSS